MAALLNTALITVQVAFRTTELAKAIVSVGTFRAASPTFSNFCITEESIFAFVQAPFILQIRAQIALLALIRAGAGFTLAWAGQALSTTRIVAFLAVDHANFVKLMRPWRTSRIACVLIQESPALIRAFPGRLIFNVGTRCFAIRTQKVVVWVA